MQSQEDTAVINRDVLAIFVIKRDSGEPIYFCGTGFVIAPSILITCAHCVNADLPQDHVYGVLIQEEDRWISKLLVNIEKDPSGCDLATANVDLAPSIPWILPQNDLLYGEDVFTFGYPLLDKKRLDSGMIQFQVSGRYLQGYVTRPFYFDLLKDQRIKSYELDMPAPAGISGAPLIGIRSHKIYGVIYGANDVGTVAELSYLDEETGQLVPEKQRILSFGLAHHTDSLRHLRGSATRGLSLSEFMSK
jgi:hypothetical protein